MEFATIHNIPHFVFDNEEEFNDHFIAQNINPIPKILKDWRDAEEFDWVWSDDGRIVQVLKVGILKRRKNCEKDNKYVRTVVGSFNVEMKMKMDTTFSEHPNRYTFSKSASSGKNAVLNRIKPTLNEELWASEIVLLGREPWDAYKRIFKTKDIYNCKKKAMVLLKQERIINFMDKLVTDTASRLGLDHEWVLQRYKSAAETGSSEKVKLEAVDRISEIIGTAGEKQKETKTLGAFKGFGSGDLDILGTGKIRRELQDAEIVEEISE